MMERNWDVVRHVLMDIEDGNREWRISKSQRWSNEVIFYHVEILVEAGLITRVELDSGGTPFVQFARLTWQGHEYLDSIRDRGVWEKVKEKISILPSVTLAIIQGAAGNVLSDLLK